MAWRVSGQFIETCSCNMFCPCWFLNPEVMVMDQGWCDSTLAFRIRDGNSDGLALGGLDVVIGIDFPGPTLFDGGGTARVYLPESANAPQRTFLESLFQGKSGGPWAQLAPLVATWLPTQAATIQVNDGGDVISVAIAGVGQLESRRLRDGEGMGFELRGGGFVHGMGMESVDLANSATRWSDSGLPRTFETKSGARGNFTWSG